MAKNTASNGERRPTRVCSANLIVATEWKCDRRPSCSPHGYTQSVGWQVLIAHLPHSNQSGTGGHLKIKATPRIQAIQAFLSVASGQLLAGLA